MASIFTCRVPHIRHYLRPASTHWISFATTENLMEYDRRYGMILTVQNLNVCKYLVMRATNFIYFSYLFIYLCHNESYYSKFNPYDVTHIIVTNRYWWVRPDGFSPFGKSKLYGGVSILKKKQKYQKLEGRVTWVLCGESQPFV